MQAAGAPMARPGDRIGSVLGKHGYRQVKKIGEGSFGAAILVQHEQAKADDKVIAKIVDISRASKQERDDAVKESKVLAALKHPYVVRYRESFHEDGYLCIVMDYCEGGDLSEAVKKARKSGKSFPQEQVLRWFTQAALALKYIHDKHILHRDLKSGNFFISKSGNIKIGDFGIAKVLECTAACAQTQIGTPYYLSPEICQGKAYSWGSDIWSMGCILYEMCSKKVPFDAPDLKSLIKKITNGPTPELPAEYSASLRSLLQELLNRDPTKRPQATEILKRPVVQEMVRRMLDEVKDAEEEASSARQSVSAGGPKSSRSKASAEAAPAAPAAPAGQPPLPAAPSPKDMAGTYVKLQQVEYYSPTHKEWLPAQVTNVDPEGKVMLNVKPNVWLSLDLQGQRVRPRQDKDKAGSRPPTGAAGGSAAGTPATGRESAKGGSSGEPASGRPPSTPAGAASAGGRDRQEAARLNSAGQKAPSPRQQLGGAPVAAGGGSAAAAALRRRPSQDQVGARRQTPPEPQAAGTPAGGARRQPSRGSIFG